MSERFGAQPMEGLVASLSALYDHYGYARYKMNRFEEYDLYANHRDFLVSDSVITFTDGTGKLMALKPDVTLSIVKNTRDGQNGIERLYYNENVFRAAKGSRSFKEITQVGLEAIGSIDDYCIYEVISLAARSLQLLPGKGVLEISHLGLLDDLLESAGISPEDKTEAMRLIGEKNAHELAFLCQKIGVSPEKAELLKRVMRLHGSADEALEDLTSMLKGHVCEHTLSHFNRVIAALGKSDAKPTLTIDMSLVGDLHYYNGFVFKGFMKGIPQGVLSGGQYDRLMRKMKRASSAIGFAVYLDQLEQLWTGGKGYDADIVLLYDESSSLEEIDNAVRRLMANGESVLARREIGEGMQYRRLVKLRSGEVDEIEGHA